MRKREPRPKTTTVGVRLSDELRARLEALALELKTTPSAVARLLIELSLTGDTASRLDTLVKQTRTVQESLLVLNRNLGNSALAILAKDRKLTVAEAQDWAKKRLRPLPTTDA